MVARLQLHGICSMNGESSTLAINNLQEIHDILIAMYFGQFEG